MAKHVTLVSKLAFDATLCRLGCAIAKKNLALQLGN